MACDHVVLRERAAAIGHVPQRDAGHAHEQLEEDVMHRADTGRRKGKLARLAFGERDESFTELTPSDGLTTSTNGTVAKYITGEKSLVGS
jgi:hypothetical protein